MQHNRSPELTIPLDDELHEIESKDLNPEALLLQSADTQMVRQALEELPVEFREVLVLRELEGLILQTNCGRGGDSSRDCDVPPGACPQTSPTRPCRSREQRDIKRVSCRSLLISSLPLLHQVRKLTQFNTVQIGYSPKVHA